MSVLPRHITIAERLHGILSVTFVFPMEASRYFPEEREIFVLVPTLEKFLQLYDSPAIPPPMPPEEAVTARPYPPV